MNDEDGVEKRKEREEEGRKGEGTYDISRCDLKSKIGFGYRRRRRYMWR